MGSGEQNIQLHVNNSQCRSPSSSIHITSPLAVASP
jgi:hypothetical protein